MTANKMIKSEGSQKQKFIVTAKELGCDESETAFNEKLKKLTQKKGESEGTKPDSD